MNAAELSKKPAETTQRHVTNITSESPPTRPVTSAAPAHTSSVLTSRADDVIASVRHPSFPLYYDDVNIPSDSYFTGDEEIPVWNVQDHVPLLDAATPPAAVDDDDDDDRDVDDVDKKLLALGKLILSQLSPYITASNSAGNGRSHDVASAHKLVTSSVSTETSTNDSYGKASTTTMTTPLQSQVPLTSTMSPLSQIISRLFATTTTDQKPASQTYSTSSRDHSHVIADRHDVTTTTSIAVRDVVNHSAPSDAKSAVYSAAAVPRPQQQATAAAAVRNAGRAGRLVVPRRQLGGFDTWGSPRHGLDYFDFFDYVVEYQTPRPPRRRPHLKTRRQRKKSKSHRVKHGQSPNTIFTWPREPRSGAVDSAVEQLDVVGQSYDVEVTGAGSQNFAGSFARRGTSQRRRLPQSVSGWVARDQPQHRRKSVKARGSSHLAAAARKNLRHRNSGARFLKEGENMETADSSAESVEPIQGRRSTVHGDEAPERVIYTRPKHHYVDHHVIPIPSENQHL